MEILIVLIHIPRFSFVTSSRVIQKAFDELSQRDFANLVSTFEGNVLLCLHNHNGNHVIQKAITILSSYAKEAQENGDDELCSFFLQSLEPIIDEIVEEVEHLSKHSMVAGRCNG